MLNAFPLVGMNQPLSEMAMGYNTVDCRERMHFKQHVYLLSNSGEILSTLTNVNILRLNAEVVTKNGRRFLFLFLCPPTRKVLIFHRDCGRLSFGRVLVLLMQWDPACFLAATLWEISLHVRYRLGYRQYNGRHMFRFSQISKYTVHQSGLDFSVLKKFVSPWIGFIFWWKWSIVCVKN